MLNVAKYGPAAKQFSESYMANPPGEADHEIIVCLNGGNGVGPYQRKLFEPLPVTFIEHNNWGKDLGAFQMAAESIPCDLIIFMGSHVNFYRPLWLDRIVQAYEENGPALYGAWAFHQPATHIRTTFFWCPPELFRAYPVQISDRDRYAAEHGGNSITLWAKRTGFETLMVTFDAILRPEQWRHAGPPECLALDQHTQG